MSNETIVVMGTTKTLESSGSSISNNAIVAATTAYDLAADGGYFPDGDVQISFTFTSAPTEGAVLAVYAQPLDIDGTNDAEAPETSRPGRYICSFPVNDVTTTQYDTRLVRDLPMKATYYVHNNGTGQSVNSGWKLAIKPRTYKQAA